MTGDEVAAIAACLDARAARLGSCKLVLIDGPSGAGKTVLADRLAPALDAQVIHTDDLVDGWDGQFTYWERLRQGVLEPIRAGMPGRYQTYDWHSSRFAEWVEVPAADVLIVEGVGAGRAEGRMWASLTIYIDTPEPVRVARSLERDGPEMQKHLETWRRREETHFAADATARCADVIIEANQCHHRKSGRREDFASP